MSLQHEVFALPPFWSRHLSLLAAWSDSAFAAGQEILRLQHATWGHQAEAITPEFPFLNWYNPHAIFTLQEQWTLPNVEHLIDYQSAYTQILSDTSQRMAQAWADYEVLQPAVAAESESAVPRFFELQWQIPGLSLTQFNWYQQLSQTDEITQAAPVVVEREPQTAVVIEQSPQSLPEALIIEPVVAATDNAEPIAPGSAEAAAEFAEIDHQQAVDVAAAAVAKAKANSSDAEIPPVRSSAVRKTSKASTPVAPVTTASKSPRSNRSTSTKNNSVAASASAAIASKKKSSKA